MPGKRVGGSAKNGEVEKEVLTDIGISLWVLCKLFSWPSAREIKTLCTI